MHYSDGRRFRRIYPPDGSLLPRTDRIDTSPSQAQCQVERRIWAAVVQGVGASISPNNA
jgi:hypothetical protein